MHDLPIKLRRLRRTDFTAVMDILASNGLPVPPPDRATLRRFRRIVGDRGSDVYVAVIREEVVGFVYVTYTRRLAGAPRARIEFLGVREDRRGRGIGSSLLNLAVVRSRRRRCGDLECAVETSGALDGFLRNKGWTARGRTVYAVPDMPSGSRSGEDAAKKPDTTGETGGEEKQGASSSPPAG